MVSYKITESVVGNICIIKASNPINALKLYIKECVLINPDNDSWDFDFSIEKMKDSEIIMIQAP